MVFKRRYVRKKRSLKRKRTWGPYYRRYQRRRTGRFRPSGTGGTKMVISTASSGKGKLRRRGKMVPRWKWGKAPFPQNVQLSLTYMDTGFELSTSSASSYQAHHIFRGNSLYDPDYTGVGVQPYWHDKFEAIYRYYYVAASKVTFYIYNPSSTRIMHAFLIPYKLSSGIYPDSRNNYMTKERMKTVVSRWDASRNINVCKISHYCSTKTFYENDDEENMFTTFGSNPDNIWYWHLMVDTGVAQAEVTVGFDVKIKHYCQLKTLYDNETEN